MKEIRLTETSGEVRLEEVTEEGVGGSRGGGSAFHVCSSTLRTSAMSLPRA